MKYIKKLQIFHIKYFENRVFENFVNGTLLSYILEAFYMWADGE